jgi:hypothetical protein
MKILTRHDEVGAAPYDSIKWAFEVHLHEQDTGEFNFAVLHGNEDAPIRIQFWRDEAPLWRNPPDKDWKPEPRLPIQPPATGGTA